VDLSIIVPVYNSSKILDELIERILNTIKKIKLVNYEILLINDYSMDESWNKIKFLSKKYTAVRGINLSQNFGQHNAIMAGLNNCKGALVITIDDDLQHPPESLPIILKKLNECDVCYTYYKNRKHKGWKKIVSKINNIVSSFLLDKPLNIYMSSFRGIKKKIVKDIVNFKNPDVYIDGLIIKSTKNIKMVTVDHHARKEGQSNYTFKKLVILWSNMLIDFQFYPIRLSSPFGLTLKFIIKLLRKRNEKPQYNISEFV